MSKREKEVVNFLHYLSQKPELVNELRSFPKQEVLNYGKKLGYNFTENEYDATVWGMEGFLAEKLGETFDLSFSLWETMWGKYYLEFVIDNVFSALSEQDIESLLGTM